MTVLMKDQKKYVDKLLLKLFAIYQTDPTDSEGMEIEFIDWIQDKIFENEEI